MQVVGSVVLLCSFLGYIASLRRVRRLHPAWTPGLVLGGASVLLVLAGMAGVLEPATWLIVGGGLALGGYEVFRHPRDAGRTLGSPAIVLFLVVVVALLIGLRGAVMTHYDNFSHWGLVVHVMLDRQGLPTEEDSLVLFTTYPLGAAVLSYLAGRTVAPSDVPMLVIHNLWIAAGALPLMAFAGRAWRWAVMATLACIVLLQIYVTPPNSLLVDPLVGSQVAWAALFVFWYRDQIGRRLPELSLVLTSLVAVKTSGALFAAALTAIALVVAWRHRPQGAKVWLLSPLVMVLAWQWHVARNFPDADEAKHSVSVSRYTGLLAEKSSEQLSTIVSNLGVAILTDWFLWLAIGALVLAAWALVRHGMVSRRGATWVVVLTLLMTAIWSLALLGTYVFSMPIEEAMRLAGVERYMQTWHFVVVLMAAALWLCFLASRDRPLRLVAAVVATALPLSLAVSAVTARTPQSVSGIPIAEYREKVESGLAQVTLEDGEMLCVATAGEDRGFTRHLTRYLSLHPEVRSSRISVDDPPDWSGECAEVIILTEQPLVQQAFEDLGIPVVVVP